MPWGGVRENGTSKRSAIESTHGKYGRASSRGGGGPVKRAHQRQGNGVGQRRTNDPALRTKGKKREFAPQKWRLSMRREGGERQWPVVSIERYKLGPKEDGKAPSLGKGMEKREGHLVKYCGSFK